jgi:hypothetical protein
MLIEILEYRLTPDGPLSRDYDYLAQAVSLGSRYRRQRKAWAPHVENCRRFTLDAMTRARRGGRALVLGSGRLIEVPLAELAAYFSEVTLLDMAQPMITRRLARRFPNVRLVADDATGVLRALSAALNGDGPLPDPTAAEPLLAGERFDFALSANLMSQLPLLPDEAVERRRPDVDDKARQAFGRGLIEQHVRRLQESAEVAALYTDIYNCWIDAAGHEAERNPTTWGAALPTPDVIWEWLIAPAPEEEKLFDRRHVVAGWRNLAKIHT